MRLIDSAKRWLEELRALEDEDVRRIVREIYGPLLRINNLFSWIDPGMVPIAIAQAIIFYVLSNCYLYLFLITCFLLRDDFVLVSVQFHYLLLAVFGTVFTLHLNGRRREICMLHKIIAINFYDYGDLGLSEERVSVLKQMIRTQRLRLIPFIILIALIGLFIVLVGPFIDHMVGAASDVDYKNGVYMRTPIPMYFPFAINNFATHYLATAFQMMVVSMLALAICGTVYLNIVTSQNLAHQLRIFKATLECILERSEKLFKKLYPAEKFVSKNMISNEKFQNCILYCLKQNAQHHQRMRDYYHIRERVTQLPIMAAFFMGTLVLALAMMVLVEKSDRIGLLTTNTLAMIGELGNLYIACSFGEEVLTTCAEVRQSLYDIKWYKMDKKNRVLIMSLQDCTKHPFVMKGSYVFTCSMNTFSSIINSAYSYFNMLNAASKQAG